MESVSQDQKQGKSSIFLCKSCKQSEVKIQQVKKQKDPNQKIIVKLSPTKDTHQDQKWLIKIGSKTVGFGAKTYSDYTLHKNSDRQALYINRHKKREERFWDVEDKSNLYTSAFWAYHLLWQYKDIFEAIEKLQELAGIQIKFTKSTVEKQQKKLQRMIKKSGEDEDQ